MGTFDGNGKKITNLNVTGKEYVGLFGCVYNAVIKNLALEGSAAGTNRVALLAGYACGSFTADNVNISGSTECSNSGALGIGYLNPGGDISITNCSFAGSVECIGNYGALGIGDLYNDSFEGNISITGCSFEGNIECTGYCVALGVGCLEVDYGSSLITNCSFKGEVEADEAAGAIIGYTEASTLEISDCNIDAYVTAEEDAGLFIGVPDVYAEDLIFSGCTYTGTVETDATYGLLGYGAYTEGENPNTDKGLIIKLKTYTADEQNKMAYKIADGYYGKSIDVMGFYNGSWIKTTYSNEGYWTSTLGVPYDASVSCDASFDYDGNYVRMTYTLTAGETAVENGVFAVAADVQIGDNDGAPVTISYNENGDAVSFEMKDDGEDNPSYDATFRFVFGDMPGVTPVDTWWIGGYYDYESHLFDTLTADTTSSRGTYSTDEETGRYTGFSGADSALAVSWNNINLEPGESRKFCILVGVGGFSEAPEWAENPKLTVTNKDGTTLQIDTKVQNHCSEEKTVSLYCDLDGKTNTGIGNATVPADESGVAGAKDISADYSVADLADGDHLLTFSMMNDSGRLADTVVRKVIRMKDGRIVNLPIYTGELPWQPDTSDEREIREVVLIPLDENFGDGNIASTEDIELTIDVFYNETTGKYEYSASIPGGEYNMIIRFTDGTTAEEDGLIFRELLVDSCGGTDVQMNFDENTHLVAKCEDPTREGYTFDGWYNDSAYTNAWDFENDTVDGKVTLYAKWLKNIASITKGGVTTYYTALPAAVDAAENGDTITFLCDASGDGVDFEDGKKVTIDFAGYSYTFQGQMAGETKSSGFCFAEGSAVTLKNGTLLNGAAAEDGSTPAAYMINNSGSLTLENFSVNGTTEAIAAEGAAYGTAALYTANGKITLKGTGSYTGDPDGYAVYAANVAGYAGGTTLAFDKSFTGTVSGRVSDCAEQSAIISIAGGRYDLSDIALNKCTFNITGGVFKTAPDAGFIPDGYSVTTNTNKATKAEYPYTVVALSVTPPTAISGLTYNGSLQALIKAGKTTVGTFLYSTDGTNYSADIPKATNAGTYKVWYKLTGTTKSDDIDAKSLSVTIAKKKVTVSGITAKDKTYDGTKTAKLVLKNAKIKGVVSGDTVSVKATGRFTQKTASANITVMISGLKLTGKDAANYVLAAKGQQTVTKASINPKPIILAKAEAVGSNAIKITWSKVKGAVKYVVYAADCDKTGSCEKVKTTTGTSFTLKKISGKKLSANNSYKFYVVSYDADGNKISKSLMGHAITGGYHGQYGNVTKVTVNAAAKTLKVGKTFTIKATLKNVKNKLSLNHCSTVRYQSSNTNIAKVDANGKVTAVSKGTCIIYTVSITGVWAKTKITVK